MSLRGMAGCALALCFFPSAAWPKQSVSESLSEDGYHPVQMERDGVSACQSHSLYVSVQEFGKQNEDISAYVKRQELVYSAVGFAEAYARKRNTAKRGNVLGAPGFSFNPFEKSDYAATGQLILKLSKIKNGDEWCAAFVATLSKMVDEQSGGGASNLLHSGSSADAGNYASAAKLLAIFDPAVSLNSIAWPKGDRPRKRTDAFLPTNLPPVPGCMAIYRDIDAHVNHIVGHMALVVSVSGDGTLNTVEGNTSPIPGSPDRGVFAKLTNRPWGKNATLVDPGDGHHLVYQGCVMPWPGDSVVFDGNVCQDGASDASLKPYEVNPLDLTDIPSFAGAIPSSSGAIR